jgi:hypothetical protein
LYHKAVHLPSTVTHRMMERRAAVLADVTHGGESAEVARFDLTPARAGDGDGDRCG